MRKRRERRWQEVEEDRGAGRGLWRSLQPQDDWPLCPYLFQPHLAGPDGKIKNRYESLTHTEKASSQRVSKRLRLSGMEPTSMFPSFSGSFLLFFHSIEGSQSEQSRKNPVVLYQWYPRGKEPRYLFCPRGLLFLGKSVQRMEDFAAGIGRFPCAHLPVRTRLPFSTESRYTETPGFPPACKPGAQMSRLLQMC